MHIEVNQIPNSLRSWVHIWKPGFLSGFSANGGGGGGGANIKIIRGWGTTFFLCASN